MVWDMNGWMRARVEIWQLAGWKCPWLITLDPFIEWLHCHKDLVGGWTNLFEKYAPQIGSFLQGEMGEKQIFFEITI